MRNSYSTIFTYTLLVGFSVTLLSCTDAKPRRPINKKSTLKEKSAGFATRSRSQYDYEDSLIKKYIDEHGYQVEISPYGFFYQLESNLTQGRYPKKGDEVHTRVIVKNLDNRVLYHWEQVGLNIFRIDETETIKGLNDAVKLMKEGEQGVFFFNSYHAYGVVGDRKKIAPNMPLVYHIEVIKIVFL